MTDALHAVINTDPLIEDAAHRAFADHAASYYDKAGDDPQHNRALREKLLAAIDELGFCDALPDPQDAQGWADAASIIRAQAAAAAPLDMVQVLVAGERAAAIADEPGNYAAIPARDPVHNPSDTQDALTPLIVLGRLLQLTAAMDTALDISLQYVQDRKQFGRPLAAFQAIQHGLAIAAEEAAAARAITDLALARVVREANKNDHQNDDRLHALLTAAVLVTGHAASVVYGVTHQVHGAIGFTIEYALHRHTLNILRWRDDIYNRFGSDIACAEQVGAHAAKAGGVWQAVTTLMKTDTAAT